MNNLLLTYLDIANQSIKRLQKEKLSASSDYERGIYAGQIIQVEAEMNMLKSIARAYEFEVEANKRHVN